ncbi:MAG: hypothetical protein FWE76_04870 [Symbiobacteriaceae bacterium]|nr:hypothetical protein [Symbiobacteriaceae bacterium]
MILPDTLHNEGNVARLAEAIEQLTQEQQDSLQRDTVQRRLHLLSEAQERINREREQGFSEGVADLTESLGGEQSQKISQLRQRLFKKREEYAAAIFTATAEELANFVASEVYRDFLCSLAARISKRYDCNLAEVHLRQEDLPLQTDLRQYIASEGTFVADEEIKLGGFLVWLPHLNMLLDERLETRLENEKQWFYEESGLHIIW